MASIILPQFFLPPSSVKLGRFITSIESPSDGYHDPELTGSSSSPFVSILTVKQDHTRNDSRSVSHYPSSSLTRILSANLSRGVKTPVTVTAGKVTTSTLPDSEAWFRESTTLRSTRTWIERQIDQGHKIYLIVGLHVIDNARIVQSTGDPLARDSAEEGSRLASLDVALFLRDVLDPSVEVERKNDEDGNAEFFIKGEQVCALQCRRVGHKSLSSTTVDKAKLKKPWWLSVEKWRDEEEGEDDIIDVKVRGQEAVEDDLVGDGWTREEIDGEIWFSAFET